RLCNAAIPPQSAPLNADRQKRILLSRFWSSALRGTDLGMARGQLCMIACRGPGSASPGPQRTRSAVAHVGGGQRPQSALLETHSDAKPARAARAFAAAQASAVAMTKDEERELREQLARLQQEHRDLDAAISALQHSPGSDLLQ